MPRYLFERILKLRVYTSVSFFFFLLEIVEIIHGLLDHLTLSESEILRSSDAQFSRGFFFLFPPFA